MRRNFPFRKSTKQDFYSAKTRDGQIFVWIYIQCEFEFPDEIKYKFINFPVFEKITVIKADFEKRMQKNKSENNQLKEPQRMLISSFKLENGTTVFFSSVDYARRAGEESPDSSVVTGTMKMLGNTSSGNDIMESRNYIETKYQSNEQTHKAIKGKIFKM